MQNLNLRVESNKDGEIIIREGKVPDLPLPKVIDIHGDIDSISNFLKIRHNALGNAEGLQEVEPGRVIVLVDKKALTIEMQLDPEFVYGTRIKGTLERSDELQPFYINQNKTFTKEELVKLIKFNKIYFDDAAKHAEMLVAFQKVSSTLNIRANESSDDRGNKERQFVKEVTSNAPTEFILNVPIFKGFPAVRFRVEVCLDVTDGSARFWFESVELHELTLTLRDQIFADQLEYCKDFVVINK